MPIIKFVNESEKIEYPTEQDVCSLLIPQSLQNPL